MLGWVETELGRLAAGVEYARQAVEVQTGDQDAVLAPLWEENLLRVYIAADMRKEAIELAGGLLAEPSLVSKAWLAADPLFAGLRAEEEFRALIDH
jgi:hypothetical protein